MRKRHFTESFGTKPALKLESRASATRSTTIEDLKSLVVKEEADEDGKVSAVELNSRYNKIDPPSTLEEKDATLNNIRTVFSNKKEEQPMNL